MHDYIEDGSVFKRIAVRGMIQKESISEGILVHEKRKGDPDDLLEMDSYYYSCDVEGTNEYRWYDTANREYNNILSNTKYI